MKTRVYIDTEAQSSNPLTTALLLVFFAAIIIGCGESPLEPQDSVPRVPFFIGYLRSSARIPDFLTALDFPTADGSSWEYVSTGGEHTYTVRINGTKNVGGLAARIQESDSEIPVTQLGAIYGVPIRSSFFTKDLDSYTEHALEFWLATADDTLLHRNLPKRVLWSFPLYVGKEWESVFSQWLFGPAIIYTRKVVSDKNVVVVPAGIFENVYYAEEHLAFADLPAEEELPPSKYWIAPDVGIIKYEFMDPFFNVTTVYELSRFEKGRRKD